MNQPSISVSAPGSLMLLGEHAVLHGRRALVCAIDKRITVSRFHPPSPEGSGATGSLEKTLKINSALGTYQAPLSALEDHPDFRFVLDAVKQYPLEQGVELKIESEFSSDIGFGSSAAVTVATHAALMKLCSGSLGEFAPPVESENAGRATPPAEPYKMELFKRSLATIRRVQGCGSGADVAASVFGGVVAYRANPLEIQRVGSERGIFDARSDSPSVTFPLTAVYSGSKMKTVDVIRHLEERRARNAETFEKIFDRMDASVGEVINDFASLGEMLILNQKLMEEMGLCNDALSEIIAQFKEQGIPAKISGSGLGDCAVGLAAPTGLMFSNRQNKPFGDYPVYALRVDPQGVHVER